MAKKEEKKIKEEEDQYLIRLGENIKRIRIEKGISQKELAHGCEFDPPNIRRIEAGKTNPTTRTLLKIAMVLGVDIRDLMIANT